MQLMISKFASWNPNKINFVFIYSSKKKCGHFSVFNAQTRWKLAIILELRGIKMSYLAKQGILI